MPRNIIYKSKRLDIQLYLRLDYLIDFLIYINDCFQPEIIRVLKELCEEKNITHFIDVGSHIGQMSIFVAKNFPNITVWSFEPNSITYKQQIKNVELNKVDIITENIGFADQSKKLWLEKKIRREFAEYFKINDGVCFTSENSHSDLEMMCLTLDKINEKITVASKVLIKIDVEGSEIDVLKGGYELLNRNNIIIIIELLFESNMDKCQECITLLKRLGYKIYDLKYAEINDYSYLNGDYIFMKS